MAGKGNTVSKVTEIITPYAKELGLEIWDVRFAKEGTGKQNKKTSPQIEQVHFLRTCSNQMKPLNHINKLLIFARRFTKMHHAA